MSKWEKFRAKLLSGESDRSIEFDELCNYLKRLGSLRRFPKAVIIASTVAMSRRF
jgi:hypothetical protein